MVSESWLDGICTRFSRMMLPVSTRFARWVDYFRRKFCAALLTLIGLRCSQLRKTTVLPDWSNIPSDVLEEITKRLLCWDDNTHFRSVCSSWRSAALKRPHLPLLLCNKDYEEAYSMKFCKFPDTTNLYRPPRLPEDIFKGKTICASTGGWIGLFDRKDDYDTMSVSLYNPTSGVHIQLPNISNPEFSKLRKLVLSSNPTVDPERCVVMAICLKHYSFGRKNSILHCRPGDSSWTPAIYPASFNDFIKDIIFYKGEFYAVSDSYRVFVCHIAPYDSVYTKILLPDPVFFGGPTQRWHQDLDTTFEVEEDLWDLRWEPKVSTYTYLVEASCDLLLAQITYLDCRVSHCEVFQVNLDGGQIKLFKQKDLDGRAMFICNTSTSLSLSIENTFPSWCRGNCIYYSGLECAVVLLNMESSRISFLTDQFWPPRFWFTPSLC